jgi:tetratricopeptide (TPR) repeat protein
MLAMDKAEDLVAEYFKKYGQYFLSGSDVEKFGLQVLFKEISNVCNLYKSHRLFVYFSLVNIYHRLFVDTRETDNEDEEPIEDILQNVEKIFEDYSRDSIYYNLNVVFEFLKLEYYNFYKVFRKAERYFDEVNFNAALLLSNYNLYTFPPQFLLSKSDRAVRMEMENALYEENKTLFADYEVDLNDIPRHIIYIFYRSASCYYAEKYDEAARYLNNLLNDLSLKRYPQAQIEIKLFLALQYCLLNDYDLFNQCVNSIQRSIRISDKSNSDHVQIFIKILKTSLGENKKTKPAKIKSLIDKLRFIEIPHFSAIKHIRMDERFISRLS